MITIRYDFVVGDELSYIEGLSMGDNFATNCLDFFTFGDIDVYLVRKDGGYICVAELLSDRGYSSKCIRIEHDLVRLLKGGVLKFKYKNEDGTITYGY
ncbi:MAG: hypothetical protein ACRDD8_06890 [Bacteroidales bacterium]